MRYKQPLLQHSNGLVRDLHPFPFSPEHSLRHLYTNSVFQGQDTISEHGSQVNMSNNLCHFFLFYNILTMCSVGFPCSVFCFLFFRQFSALFLCFLPLAVFGKFTFVTCSRSPARVQLFLPSSGFFSLSKPTSATEAGTLTDPVKKILTILSPFRRFLSLLLRHSFPIIYSK